MLSHRVSDVLPDYNKPPAGRAVLDDSSFRRNFKTSVFRLERSKADLGMGRREVGAKTVDVRAGARLHEGRLGPDCRLTEDLKHVSGDRRVAIRVDFVFLNEVREQ